LGEDRQNVEDEMWSSPWSKMSAFWKSSSSGAAIDRVGLHRERQLSLDQINARRAISAASHRAVQLRIFGAEEIGLSTLSPPAAIHRASWLAHSANKADYLFRSRRNRD
jgi:hypothetical protein